MQRPLFLAVIISAIVGGLVGANLDRYSNAQSIATAVQQAQVAIATAGTMHCEIPCGIFDDHAQIEAMRLDAKTIGKANAQLIVLMSDAMFAGDPVAIAQHANTMMRWVIVKEEHSKKIQHAVAWYFMTQRVKRPADGDVDAMQKYYTQLAAFDAVATAAMKASQSTEESSYEALLAAIDVVAPWYPAPKADDGG